MKKILFCLVIPIFAGSLLLAGCNAASESPAPKNNSDSLQEPTTQPNSANDEPEQKSQVPGSGQPASEANTAVPEKLESDPVDDVAPEDLDPEVSDPESNDDPSSSAP